MGLFQGGSFLLVSPNHSPERLRRERKNALDIIFTLLNFDAQTNQDTLKYIFGQIDEKLKDERRKQIDTEYGSFHHVLYGMCSGSDDYLSPIWLNPQSSFHYLPMVVPLLFYLGIHL